MDDWREAAKNRGRVVQHIHMPGLCLLSSVREAGRLTDTFSADMH